MSDPYRSRKTVSNRNFILFLLTAADFLLAGCFFVLCLLDRVRPNIDLFSRSLVKLLLQGFSLLVLVRSVVMICYHTLRGRKNAAKGVPGLLEGLGRLLPHGTLILSIMFTVFCILDGFNPHMAFVNGRISKTLLLIFAAVDCLGCGISLFAWLRAALRRRSQGSG